MPPPGTPNQLVPTWVFCTSWRNLSGCSGERVVGAAPETCMHAALHSTTHTHTHHTHTPPPPHTRKTRRLPCNPARSNRPVASGSSALTPLGDHWIPSNGLTTACLYGHGACADFTLKSAALMRNRRCVCQETSRDRRASSEKAGGWGLDISAWQQKMRALNTKVQAERAEYDQGEGQGGAPGAVEGGIGGELRLERVRAEEALLAEPAAES